MQGAANGLQSTELLNPENTCTPMMLASLATPEKLVPRPAAIPATWVPCSQPSIVVGQLMPAPFPTWVVCPFGHSVVIIVVVVVEKHASATTLPARKGWVLSTPVSRMAMACPAPEKPAVQAPGAPIRGTLCTSVGGTGISSIILPTAGEAWRASRAAASTFIAR